MVVDYLSKTKEEDKHLKKQDIQDIFFQNELDKVCIQHDIAYRDFTDFTRRAASDKTLYDKASSIAKNSRYDGYHCGLAFMIYKLFDKKVSDSTADKSAIKNKNILNPHLAEELHKPIITKF